MDTDGTLINIEVDLENIECTSLNDKNRESNKEDMMIDDEDSSISRDESGDSKSSSNYDDDGSGNGSYELKNMEQDNQFKENPTSSINVI